VINTRLTMGRLKLMFKNYLLSTDKQKKYENNVKVYMSISNVLCELSHSIPRIYEYKNGRVI